MKTTEVGGTKYDIRRYRRVCSGYAGEPPCKAAQERPPKDFINAFPFHRLVEPKRWTSAAAGVTGG